MSGHRYVVVTTRSFGSGTLDPEATLMRQGLTVTRSSPTHDPRDLALDLAEAEAWIAGVAPVTDEMLTMAPRLKVIARYGVGVDSIDLAAARCRGIWVTNTPGANSEAVAEHAVALILAALRHVVQGDHEVRHGSWRARRGRELGSVCVGVVGAGRVGRGVLRRMSALGADTRCTDPYLSEEGAAALGVILVDAKELAATCDVVSLHAPGGQIIVDASWLAVARPGQLLVNTARADLVDEAALAAALRQGRVRGFAADTLSTEKTRGASSALLDPELADRVILTPHVAAQTVEAVDRMGSMAVSNVLAVLSGAAPPNPVSMETA